MSLAKDLLSLTKPLVISLLLLTAIAPMFITDRGLPPLALIGWVLLASFLMAGGANAINMWFDLGAVSFARFWRFANPLADWLALAGLLFYVFSYTMWLKHWSPQHIVIGGAAGSFPPLVGWAP